MHGQPFRATKDPVQPPGCTKFLFGLEQKYFISSRFITPGTLLPYLRTGAPSQATDIAQNRTHIALKHRVN